MGLPLKITILSIIIYTIAAILLFRFDPTGHFNVGNSLTVTLTIFGSLVLGLLLIMGFKKDIMYGFKGGKTFMEKFMEYHESFLYGIIRIRDIFGFYHINFSFFTESTHVKKFFYYI